LSCASFDVCPMDDVGFTGLLSPAAACAFVDPLVDGPGGRNGPDPRPAPLPSARDARAR
jgi:hypothetical protein